MAKKMKKKKKSKDGKQSKFQKVLHEWKEGDLKSGSKKGPRVKSQKQALAIAFSEKDKAKKKK
jgi:uncharacterized membrane protein